MNDIHYVNEPLFNMKSESIIELHMYSILKSFL